MDKTPKSQHDAPTSSDLRANLDLYRAAVNPARLELLEMYGTPLVFPRASGAWLEDSDGCQYLDLTTGYGAALLGHRHPGVIQALADVLLSSGPAFNYSVGVSSYAGQLGAKLCAVAGFGLEKVYFGNSGTEGIEAALKFAMAATGRDQFVSFSEGYHGLTLGSLSLVGSDRLKEPFPAQGVKTHRIPFGDLDALERCLQSESIAGVVIEIVQGMGGGRAWRTGDLQDISRLCREYGVKLIVDEVLTGIGRTGKWFAFQHVGTDFQPDVVVVSKGLTGGMIPTCAVLMTDEIYQAVYSGIGRANIHTSTFEGNLLAMIAGLTVIQIIEDNRLLDRVNHLSQQFQERLQNFSESQTAITEVRVLGVMISFRVSDSYDQDQDIWGAPALQRALLRKRIVCSIAAQAPSFINLLPPLNLSDDEMEWFFTNLDMVLNKTAAGT